MERKDLSGWLLLAQGQPTIAGLCNFGQSIIVVGSHGGSSLLLVG